MSARKGPKNHLDSTEMLRAVSVLGIRWTVAFRHEEITAVNEALDRELLCGNLANAYTLSGQGELALRSAGVRGAGAKLDVRQDVSCPQCRLDDDCWMVTCVRCHLVELRHVRDGDLVDTLQHVLTSHDCPAGLDALPIAAALAGAVPQAS